MTRARARRRVMAVAGARPNFMKVAPILRELRARDDFDVHLVHTGQHYDQAMSDSFFRDLGIPEPDTNLGVGSGTHAEMTAEVLRLMEPLLIEHAPQALIVVGDVNSTIAASMAAAKLQIPVAHVEAGLRSFDRSMPEEINRLMTDVISTWLFVSEPSGEKNLLREGIAPEKVHFVGNVMIDSLLANLERARKLDTLARLGVEPGEYSVLTLHRPSNVDDPDKLRALIEALEEIHAKLPVIFPVHPRTAAAIRSYLGERSPKLGIVDPLGYLDFLRLMADARFVLTDSGGIQEETTVLGVPCLTVRDNTERPVTVEQGTNLLVGSDPSALREAVDEILAGAAKRGRTPDLWDGQTARRIVDVLERDLPLLRDP